jgi:acyl carrier protein
MKGDGEDITVLLTVFRAAVQEVLGRSATDISLDTDIATLGIESLDLIEVAMSIEDRLGVVFHLEDFSEAQTVRDVLDVAVSKAEDSV